MVKADVATIPEKLFRLLSPLTQEERSRVVQATLILFGEKVTSDKTLEDSDQSNSETGKSGASKDAAAYFNQKKPKNKGEAFAVAARYRELTNKSETHTKADLRTVIADARRNFDNANFTRDLNNAKRQAGLFNLGTGRNAIKLSYYGQQFVDSLPDREITSKLKRPKVGGRKKATKKVAKN